MAAEDTTTRRVRRILREAAAEAYGYDPYAPKPDDPDAPCSRVECEHRQDEHTGEEWEGPCGVPSCRCQGFVPHDYS